MPKIMKTMDGSAAASHVAYAFSEVAAIYPITPSSNMAENVDEYSSAGNKNIFGQTVKVVEMQSEAGAAGAMHGSLSAGALTTSFTASQGLLLMIPNMYKMAGELLPGVLHVSARALASHALSIFGDHSDVMACRQTGFAMLATCSVQEVMDLSGVAHLAAIKSSLPFLHFFDGFRTSHEVQKIDVIKYEDLCGMVDYEALKKFKDRALNPEHPYTKGTAQNPDVFFQAREAINGYYDKVPEIVREYMQKINMVTGRKYDLFNYYGAPDADRIIIAMGSVCEAAEETIDYLMKKGEKVGLIKVRLFRPFSLKDFMAVVPKTVKKIAVLDRTKEPGSLGEPLYQDICTAFYDAGSKPEIFACRYGLGSKDTTPSHLKAVFDNLRSKTPMNHSTVGIEDDLTNLSLPITEEIDTTNADCISCKFWGLGSDGTIGANKNSIKIIGDHTDMYAQAYFAYDSKKSGGITISHLRFGKTPIRSTYFVKAANFVACHNPSYIDKIDMVSDIKPGGVFLLNCSWDLAELDRIMPAKAKRYIAKNNIRFYTIDGTKIGEEIGIGKRINMVMQAAFFKLSDIIPIDDAVKYMKDAIVKSYGSKGEKVVAMNYKSVDMGLDGVNQIIPPDNWAFALDEEVCDLSDKPDYIKNILEPVNIMEGDKLSVKIFKDIADGSFPNGSAAYEKRNIAINVPEWIPENCIQCNQCSYVCPHATIRPFLLTEEEAAAAPEGYKTLKAIGKGMENYRYKIQVDVNDCVGCSSCVEVCPAKIKAIVMKPTGEQCGEIPNWEYSRYKVVHKDNPGSNETVKGSQFEQPLFEFSGACSGCGETPYAKLVTQLFGDRMLIANATGCSSIWGGSFPSTPYTVNKYGKGPAWANSLFEDNAEYGFGMKLAVTQIRDKIAQLAEEAIAAKIDDGLTAALEKWIADKDNAKASRESTDALLPLLTKFEADNKTVYEIMQKKDYLVKKSQWVFGGDGWAYDIGFGGLDHVLATGEDINVLVFDTEVYSNTGGQSSKSTPTGAVAPFAFAGKRTKKKDLGMMAMSYGYVYVAQIAMGASQSQCIKALLEAEAYPGPSLVIAYSPCINHDTMKISNGFAQSETKFAVEAGYWHLYRYNPQLKAEGKNPFTLDSKEPTGNYIDFIKSEVRYSSLSRAFPETADALFKISAQDAKERYESYVKLANG